MPVDLAGMLCWATLSAAVAGKYSLRVTRGWNEPLSLWTVTALPSGERKTAIVEALRKPVVAYERSLNEALAPKIRQAEQEQRMLQGRVSFLEAQVAKADTARRRELTEQAAIAREELATVMVPQSPTLLTDDVTVERLAAIMVANNDRIGILSDEGGVFDTIVGRYCRDRGAANIDLWLRGHSGSEHRVQRVNRPPDYLARPSIVIGCTVQPYVLERLGAQPELDARGITARFLYAVPPPMAGYRKTKPAPVESEVEGQYERLMAALLDIDVGESPIQLRLTEKARDCFLEWCNDIELRLRPKGDLFPLGGWANKLPGHMARLFAIRHLATWAHETDIPNTIGFRQVQQVLPMADYAIDHARVALGMIGADPATIDARRVLATVHRMGHRPVGRQEIHRAVRLDRKRLTAALELLVEYGDLSCSNEKTGGRTAAWYEATRAADNEN